MIYDIYFLILYTQSGNPANLLEYIAERGPDSAYAVHWAKNALSTGYVHYFGRP